jgi:hypothetical protein
MEAGIGGSGPASVLNQTGELQRIVEWVNSAYQDIQDLHSDWGFLRHEFKFDCGVGVSEYTPSDAAIFADWKRDSFRIYQTTTNNEQWLRHNEWDWFRDLRLMGSSRDVVGRPINFTVKPDKSLVIWPIPDDTYTIIGEYYRKADQMTSDTSEPIFPRFHMVIVYGALMAYAAYVGESSLFAIAQQKYGKLLANLTREYLPMVTIGRALA